MLFSGINPGLVSAYTGHHFARPGNRFWPALHAGGFTPRVFAPAEQDLLRGLGLGITNVAPRATARADELSDAELVAGGERLRALVAERAPQWLAVVGIVAYRVAFADRAAVVGPQERTARPDPDLGAPEPQRAQRPLHAGEPRRGLRRAADAAAQNSIS